MLAVLPHVDLTAAADDHSLAHLICRIRGSLFYDCKMRFVNQILDQTATNKESPSVRVDRVRKIQLYGV